MDYLEYFSLSKDETKRVYYKFNVDFILTELWHTQFCHYVGNKYGNIAKIFILHLLKFGVTTMKDLITTIMKFSNGKNV